MTAQPPTPAQAAAINAATFRPVHGDVALRRVFFADLLACLDGWPIGGGRRAEAGGLYEVADPWPAKGRRVEAVICVREAGERRWYVAGVRGC